jgi:hypothetical protein
MTSREFLESQPETLRATLDRIIGIRFPSAFQSAFDEVQEEHNHTIRIISANWEWLNTFNCYAFALGIVDNPRYQAFVQNHRNSALANSGFMSALLARGELIEINEANVRIGNLAIYLADGRVTHAGVIVTDRQTVRSKWGPGELYEHGLWEVPESYGGQTQFVGAPDTNRIINLLEWHVANKGGECPPHCHSRP